MRFWFSKPHHMALVREFEQFADDMALDLTWPNKEKAPWHVQAVIGRYGRYPQTVNFWPHLMKGHWPVDRGPCVGAKDMCDMVNRAADYAYQGDDIDLVEDDDAAVVS